MYSDKDFQTFWFRYKTEGEPHGISINSFCINQGVPYKQFYAWFKNHAYDLHERTFSNEYRFKKIVLREGIPTYKMDWKIVMIVLESPVIRQIRGAKLSRSNSAGVSDFCWLCPVPRYDRRRTA